MFRKVLAAVGIGGATIETKLDRPAVALGKAVTGKARVVGGSVPQRINEIAIEACIKVEQEVNNAKVTQTRVIATEKIGDGGFDVGAGQTVEFDFSMVMPAYAPVSPDGRTPLVFMRTRLDIAGAVDAGDLDPIVTLPPPVMQETFKAMEGFGFYLAKSDIEHRSSWSTPTGFVQEFEYRPYDRSRFDEVEIVFLPTADGYDLLVQLDRSARSLRGALLEAAGLDESWRRLELGKGLKGPGKERILAGLKVILGSV